ncbi:MAG: uncharacterized protein QOG99_1461 [Frankiales bacterium]|nr:uncharacterized protein [Frankiales bacterium]
MTLELLAWRRAVSDLYAAVRAVEPAAGHALWKAGRDELFRTSSESPLLPDDPRRSTGLPVAAYDPAWRVEVPLEPAPPSRRTLEGGIGMDRLGLLRTPWGPLDAWWLAEYSGGLFVPVKDRSAGTTSYGAGRYLLDTAKGADLGGSVVVDLNFLYHPSCAYDPVWSCPLAPEGNVLDVHVAVGEQNP